MVLTAQSIVGLFEKHWEDVDRKDIDTIIKVGGGISAFEGVLLYLLIYSTRPRHVIEFSPNVGYSTTAIALAQRAKHNRWAFATFEINKVAAAKVERAMTDLKLDEYCHVIQGDALVEVPKYIKQKGAHVDLCFIDSDHTQRFAERYIANIFPSLQDNCLIAVHDIAGKTRNDNGKSAFETSLHGGRYKPGEEIAVRNYLASTNKEHCVLHSITGGKHEKANLPVNAEFYEQIKKLTGIDFRKVGGKACPKTLWFRK